MQELKEMLSAETKFRVKTRLLAKGPFFNYIDNSLPIIDHLHTLVDISEGIPLLL